MQNYSNSLKKYHRLSNYISTAMLYLKHNFLLKDQLKKEDIKDRILGHWGTVPGINLIYGGINTLIKEKIEGTKNNTKITLVTGPGHGAPAIISGLFLENTLSEFYPEASLTEEGFGYVIKQFSWPEGFPSHTYPGLPAQILEGGELGYSLGTSYGIVFDSPDTVAVTIIGDGEAETGPLAAAWQSNKFLNHEKDGAVLPILHLNGYRISGPTLFSTMSNEEIASYFNGLNYETIFVDQYELKEDIYSGFLNALDIAWEMILEYKSNGSRLPVIILKTMKGWTGPKMKKDKINNQIDRIEDNNLSHGIPLENPKNNDEEFKLLEEWLKSYKVDSLLEVNKNQLIFDQELEKIMPSGKNRIGKFDININEDELLLPSVYDHELRITEKGERKTSKLVQFAQYHRDIISLNRESGIFRFFSPDESESNKLNAIFQETGRIINRPLRAWDEYYSMNGRVMEILSEHVLQEWYEGYVKTGRYGILISYEAFLNIITSQIDQYIKYIKQSQKFSWRKSLPPLIYVATSTGWRQDHNGFSHQSPGLINSLISRQADFVSVYFPIDTNTLIAVLDDTYKRKDSVSLIIAGKRETPEYLTMAEAIEHVKNGLSIWDWASNEESSKELEVVLACAGDYQTVETMEAAKLLKEEISELQFRFVNINEITRIGLGDEQSPIILEQDLTKYFTSDKQVIFNFHGYAEVIKQLTWGTSLANRTRILAYREKGTTTTPFDMQVQNGASRYNVVIEALMIAKKNGNIPEEKLDILLEKYSKLIEEHKKYIVEHGVDMKIVTS